MKVDGKNGKGMKVNINWVESSEIILKESKMVSCHFASLLVTWKFWISQVLHSLPLSHITTPFSRIHQQMHVMKCLFPL
jgi:hypothetical protein